MFNKLFSILSVDKYFSVFLCFRRVIMEGQLSINTQRKAIHLAELNTEDLREFFQSFDTVLTDCDGVLWLQDHIIPGSPESIKKLEEMGKKVFYITNNSIKTRDEFVSKFLSLGYPAVRDDVLSTAYLTAHYLKDLKFDKKVYIVGPKGIGSELDAVGIPHIGTGPDPVMSEGLDHQIELDPGVGAVVIGLDEHISFAKLTKAASYLKNPECLFVVTNTDEIIPTPAKHLIMPDTGSIAAAVEISTGREPFHIGKPSTFVRDFVAREYKVNPARTLMIGDRGNTDILFGVHSGFKTLLVLTGVTTLAQLSDWKASDKKEQQELIPDYYIESLGDLMPLSGSCKCT